jgi:RNA polymerase sigma factor (sigma-70 family)
MTDLMCAEDCGHTAIFESPIEPPAVQPTVFIIDDDDDLRSSLCALMKIAQLACECFKSAEEFLQACDPGRSGCILLDLRMAGMGGLELQRELALRGFTLPVIIVSGYADVPAVVQAVRSGAVDVLEKPFSDEKLLELVKTVVERDVESRRAETRLAAGLAALSPRQREVMRLLLAGKGTKEIARELKISTKTVEKHRTGVLEKMRAESVVELMRMVLGSRI